MANTIIKTTKIDMDTGEIISQHQCESIYWDDEKGYLFWSRKKSVRMFSEIELPRELTDLEVAYMYRLSKRMYHNTNMLAYRGNGGIRPMDLKVIGKVIGLQYRRTVTFVNKMIRLRVMMKNVVEIGDSRETQYYINPIYFFNSKWLSLNLYLLFREDLDNVLPLHIRQRFMEISCEKETPNLINRRKFVKRVKS